jgi:alkanesulfonate monooxygenase SsuD/methylene tetrahydromethanopterin reductase-like flavin-dependent oxidoreductase (luciferase family)
VKIGVTLPQFSTDGQRAVAAAERAEAAGLDGIFVFDHLWPIGRPGLPALHGMTLLAASAARTERVDVGTLVARIGLVPDLVLRRMFETVAHIAPGRLIAGMGVGDDKSALEDEAAGLLRETPPQRFARLGVLAAHLRPEGIPVWVGGRSRLARTTASGHADAVNFWGVSVAELVDEAPLAAPASVTWGQQVLVGRDKNDLAERLATHGGLRPGLLAGTVEQIGAHLAALADAGVTYAVCAPLDSGAPDAAERVAAAAEYARGAEKTRR